jgi:hypothetical protein
MSSSEKMAMFALAKQDFEKQEAKVKAAAATKANAKPAKPAKPAVVKAAPATPATPTTPTAPAPPQVDKRRWFTQIYGGLWWLEVV